MLDTAIQDNFEEAQDEIFCKKAIENILNLQLEAKEFADENPEFMGLFGDNVDLHDYLPYIAMGQTAIEDAFAKDPTLMEHQHPQKGVSGPISPTGHCSNAIGHEGRKFGNVLVLRQADSKITYKDGLLSYAAASYFYLLTTKDIRTVYHLKSAGNEFVEATLRFSQAKKILSFGRKENDPPISDEVVLNLAFCNNEKMKRFASDKHVLAYIHESEGLVKEVEAVGLDHIEGLLGVDQAQVNDLKRKLNNFKTKDEYKAENFRMIRGMEILQALRDYDALAKAREDGNAPENIVVMFQGRITKNSFVWLKDKQRFAVIPCLDKKNPLYEHERKRFLSLLPKTDEWAEIGEELLAGSRNYRRQLALEAAMEKAGVTFRAVDTASCSDSRSDEEFIGRFGAIFDSAVLRSPGSFVSREDQIMTDAGRALAYAQLRGRTFVLSPHGCCGAQGAIDSYYKKGTAPQPFAHLAEHRRRLVKEVNSQGDTEDKIRAYYTKLTGVPMFSVADCCSIQQLLWDIKTIKKEYPDVHSVFLFQNMKEGRNYAFNPKTKKFVAIISHKVYGPKPVRTGEKNCGCGCSSKRTNG